MRCYIIILLFYNQREYQPVRIETPEPEVHFKVLLHVVPFTERDEHVAVRVVSELHCTGFEREAAFFHAADGFFGRRHRCDFTVHVVVLLRHWPDLTDGRVFKLDW